MVPKSWFVGDVHQIDAGKRPCLDRTDHLLDGQFGSISRNGVRGDEAAAKFAGTTLPRSGLRARFVKSDKSIG